MTAPRFGVRSMTAPLERALVREPGGGEFAAAGWAETPDLDGLRREHAAFAELLVSLGVELSALPAVDGFVDACYPYDPVFVTGRGAIELNMAKPARLREPALLATALEDLGVPTIGRLTGDAVADGGDMLWLDASTLAVARGYRTNAAAHRRLAAILAEEDVTIERMDLPHHRGPEHLLHLLSVVSPIADDMALVFEPLAPVPLLEALAARGVRSLHCHPDELDAQGCNALAVHPGVVVMADTCPESRRALERAGCEVHVYPAERLNLGHGGPTCLTRPLRRTG